MVKPKFHEQMTRDLLRLVNVLHNEAGERNEERNLNAMNLQVVLDMHHRRAGETRAEETLSV